MTPTDPARVAAIRETNAADMSTIQPGYHAEAIRFLLTQLDRAEAERDEARAKVRAEHDRAYEKFCAEYREFILTDERNKRMAELSAQLAAAREALERIDLALRVPAAEYVPAISDVFTIIDELKRRLDAQAEKPGVQGAPEQRELTK